MIIRIVITTITDMKVILGTINFNTLKTIIREIRDYSKQHNEDQYAKSKKLYNDIKQINSIGKNSSKQNKSYNYEETKQSNINNFIQNHQNNKIKEKSMKKFNQQEDVLEKIFVKNENPFNPKTYKPKKENSGLTVVLKNHSTIEIETHKPKKITHEHKSQVMVSKDFKKDKKGDGNEYLGKKRKP